MKLVTKHKLKLFLGTIAMIGATSYAGMMTAYADPAASVYNTANGAGVSWSDTKATSGITYHSWGMTGNRCKS